VEAGGVWMKIRNTMIIFLVSGLWHGANWTFIFWGFLNALYMLPIIIFKKKKYDTDVVAKGKYLPSIKEFLSIGITFAFTVFAWIFFRAENMTIAIECVSKIFSRTLFTIPELTGNTNILYTVIFTCLFFIAEWFGRGQPYAIAKLFPKRSRLLRYAIYYVIIIATIRMGGQDQQFIYFQF
jgi:D-alanyl-lipoteichoic acid acyltransferase DltB (MBOAT superfamily)